MLYSSTLPLSSLLASTLVFQQQDQRSQWDFVGGAVVISFLILFLGLWYSYTLKKASSYDKLPRVIFLIFLLIRWVKKSAIQLLGKRYAMTIPFFIYIVFYFWGSSFVSMFGVKGMATYIAVPIVVSGVVFIGTVVSGILFKGWGFCTDYCVWLKCKGRRVCPIPDVLKMLGELGKVVSLAMRLWGNYFAGALILFIVHASVRNLTSSLSIGDVLTTSILVWPLHLYFDVIDGALHSVIFLLLTISYWKMSREAGH
ncbi:F0F1 ATP synthase subunit A [Candidatus Mycoplasma haematolamae str. Purdue]|uniref:F0F1 ATP synthase subunit A n=1 Tax=Mycoplasma haematolamae (strain Purdue) TaxID=1212765 RepID=I7BJ48_MYCHA|nr:F0F1 ATP synthase subunit A [Candidatus Mycoplasma haematolamae]AFO51863.1 F0F1 ATP synthase subunit A [Candidatus Mycoplasma haematolamae str. Purdue]